MCMCVYIYNLIHVFLGTSESFCVPFEGPCVNDLNKFNKYLEYRGLSEALSYLIGTYPQKRNRCS